MMLDQAKDLKGLERLFKYLESLVYKHDAAVYAEASKMADAYVAEVKGAGDKQDSMKVDVVGTYRAVKYLTDHKLVPEPLPALKELDTIMSEKGWKRGR